MYVFHGAHVPFELKYGSFKGKYIYCVFKEKCMSMFFKGKQRSLKEVHVP